jgi:hypothetical protein
VDESVGKLHLLAGVSGAIGGASTRALGGLGARLVVNPASRPESEARLAEVGAGRASHLLLTPKSSCAGIPVNRSRPRLSSVAPRALFALCLMPLETRVQRIQAVVALGEAGPPSEHLPVVRTVKAAVGSAADWR